MAAAEVEEKGIPEAFPCTPVEGGGAGTRVAAVAAAVQFQHLSGCALQAHAAAAFPAIGRL